MKIIIVGATPFQREIFEPLKNVIDVEVVFVDSIVKIESSKFTLINTPKGILPDFMVYDDTIGDHKVNLDNIKLTDENGFYPFKWLFDSMQIDHGLAGIKINHLNNVRLIKHKSNKVKPKVITYGPKQSRGKGKTKRW